MAESSVEVLKQADIIFKVSQPLLDEVPRCSPVVVAAMGWDQGVSRCDDLLLLKGVGALGILGQKFGLTFTPHPHSISAIPGFRKDSEGFRALCSTDSERWFLSLVVSTVRCRCFRAHRRD